MTVTGTLPERHDDRAGRRGRDGSHRASRDPRRGGSD
jgi:hypothetical protein